MNRELAVWSRAESRALTSHVGMASEPGLELLFMAGMLGGAGYGLYQVSLGNTMVGIGWVVLSPAIGFFAVIAIGMLFSSRHS